MNKVDSLTENSFRVLLALMRTKGLCQRELAKAVGVSLGTANALVRGLAEAGFIDEASKVLPAGRRALRPYKVDNAVIMAAGMSSRFAPLSYEKPKGVLVVKGEVLIERQIRQLQEAGIKDITVVVGYMKEKFFYLQEKFGVDIVVNEDYYRYNNTSTLIRVLDRLKNTYICSSDDYFTENVFEPYVYQAYYAATYFPGPANEWGLEFDRRGRITGIDHEPVDKWCMMGHVYFSAAFSKAFKELLVRQYEREEIKSNLWEHLFERNLKRLPMNVRKYSSEVIKEFDSLEELRAFDDRYLENADSKIFSNICRVLKCSERDIGGIEVLKQGMTNLSFKFTCHGEDYVYRHPGDGTEDYISRESEAFSLGVAKRLGLDTTVVKIDAKTGWKISKFISGARNLDYHKSSDVEGAIRLMRRLHDAKVRSRHAFDIWEKTLDFIRQTSFAHKDFPDYGDLQSQMMKLHGAVVRRTQTKPILCHCDCYAPNFLIDRKGEIVLIDWEYSGAADPGVDVGTFVCCSDYTEAEADDFLKRYHGGELKADDWFHDYAYIALAAYYWFVWAVYQESRGNVVGEYLLLWYRMTKVYLKKANEFIKRKDGRR